MAGLYLNSSQTSTNIDRRLQYAEKDASAIISILNVIFSTLGLKDSLKVTLLALCGLRGNRQRFAASHLTLARQIEKACPGEMGQIDEARRKAIGQNIGRRIKAIMQTQAGLGIELVRYYPGFMALAPTADSGPVEIKNQSSEYELPFVDRAMEAYNRALKDPDYHKHPGKALAKAARAVAAEMLATAQPQQKPEKPKDNSRTGYFARAKKAMTRAIDKIGEYKLDCRLKDVTTESINRDLILLLEPFASEYNRLRASLEKTRNDTHISDHRGGISSIEICSSPSVNMAEDLAVECTAPEGGAFKIEGPIAQTFESEPAPAEQAIAMVEAFEAFGVEQFDLGYKRLDKSYDEEKDGATAKLLKMSVANKPGLLGYSELAEQSIIIGARLPADSPYAFIRLDDLKGDAIEKVSEQSFLQLETSPLNYQAWFVVEKKDLSVPIDELRAGLREAFNAGNANHIHVRLAGSVNFKTEYAPNYPRVKIVAINPGLIADLAALEKLLPKPTGNQPPPCDNTSGLHLASSGTVTRELPDYTRILERASITRANKPDVSRADFHFAALALKWGHSESAVAARLKQVSPKARARKDDYAERTVRSALRHAQQMI